MKINYVLDRNNNKKAFQMKWKNLFLYYSVFLLLLFIFGCSKEVDNKALSSDGVKISFDVVGEGEPTLVLIHGWSNNRTIWDAQVSYFSQKYKVVNIDLPGFGKSGNNRQNWDMASFGNDVATVIKKLDLEKVILVGFSMGGPVVIEAANIVTKQVAGIVLVDVLQNIEMKYYPPIVSYVDSMMMDLVTNPTKEKMVGLGFIKRNPDTSYQRVLSMLNDVSMVGWRESINDFMRWSNEDINTSLEKCQAPITAINSDMDLTNVEAFRKLAPSFKAKIVPDVGHVIMWDATEEFNSLLEESIQEFLRK